MDSCDAQRRRLLGMVAAAGATAALPLSVSATSSSSATTKQQRVGVAVVGLGGYAGYVLPRMLQCRNAFPAALISGNPDKAREWAERYAIPRDAVYGYDDYDRLAADDRVQAVHICLPVGLHAEHALRALAAGKHVLCEKPLAGSVAEARRMQAAAREHRRLLMPASRAWFSDAVQQVIRMVRDGDFGALVSIDAHKGFAMAQPLGNWRFDPALAGAGCLTDIGLYSLQLQRWIAGAEPTRVRAMIGHAADDPRYAKVESDAQWLAEFPGGVLATGSASWRYRMQNRLRVGSAQAWIELDPATPGSGERLRLGLDGPNRVEERMLPLLEQVPRMVDAFAEACLGRSELPLDSEDGVADLRFVEAILSAAGARI